MNWNRIYYTSIFIVFKFWDLSVENVTDLNRTYINMHSALTGVQVLVTRTPDHAHWLAHFCWGLLIVTAEKGKAIEISY
jgi:hypothetical protein